MPCSGGAVIGDDARRDVPMVTVVAGTLHKAGDPLSTVARLMATSIDPTRDELIPMSLTAPSHG
jgi:hypothetical protein